MISKEKVYNLQDYDNPLYWKFISSPVDYVIKDLDLALKTIVDELKWKKIIQKPTGNIYYEPNIIKFLDVGCGIGNILLIAKTLFTAKYQLPMNSNKRIYFYTDGIEHDGRLGILARDAKAGGIEIMDALQFKDYSKYDIIHYYRPIKETKLMTELENKIETEAKKGAIIIARYKTDNSIRANKSFKLINYDEKKEYFGCSDANIFIKTK